MSKTKSERLTQYRRRLDLKCIKEMCRLKKLWKEVVVVGAYEGG